MALGIDSQCSQGDGKMIFRKKIGVTYCICVCYADFIMAVKLGTELVTRKVLVYRKSLQNKEL